MRLGFHSMWRLWARLNQGLGSPLDFIGIYVWYGCMQNEAMRLHEGIGEARAKGFLVRFSDESAASGDFDLANILGENSMGVIHDGTI